MPEPTVFVPLSQSELDAIADARVEAAFDEFCYVPEPGEQPVLILDPEEE